MEILARTEHHCRFSWQCIITIIWYRCTAAGHDTCNIELLNAHAPKISTIPHENVQFVGMRIITQHIYSANLSHTTTKTNTYLYMTNVHCVD